MQMLKCCLNPRVIVGLAVVALGVVLFAPNLISGALPVLLVLVCPLSMLMMMGTMAKMGNPSPAAQNHGTSTNVLPAVDPPVLPSREARLALVEAQLEMLEDQRAELLAETGTPGHADRPAQPSPLVHA